MPIIINSKFNPFSYQELLLPLARIALEHKELENLYSELDTKASVWEKLADSAIDLDVYQLYKSYSDRVKNLSDLLAMEGLTPSSRRALLDMRTRYAKDILPIEEAYLKRLKE